MFAKTLVLSALASLVAAQSPVLSFQHVPNPVTEGVENVITWYTNDTLTPVTILLRQGISTNLQTIQVLTTEGHNEQFVWTPCTSLPDGANYALEIMQNNQTNYYGPFELQGYTGQGTCSGLVSSSTSSAMSSTITGNSTMYSNSTMTMTGNSTMTMTGNSTMTTPFMTSSMRNGTMTRTGTASATSNSAGFQSSPASGAAAEVAGGSSLALLFGAVAAIVMA